MRRRYLVVAGIVILLAGAASAYYVTKHRFGGDVLGSSIGFVPTETVEPPSAGSGLVSPMFGGVPERLHVGVGHVRPPFRLEWQDNGTSLVEFPPALAFHYLYYATLSGDLIALSTHTGRRLWTVHVGRCEAAEPAVSEDRGGIVFETFLNRKPCGAGTENPADGLLLALAAGRPHTVRWKRNLGASETSPLIVGKRLYIGTTQGDVYCLQASDGKTIWSYHVGAAVKGAIAYDGGRVFFGAYDGNLYALGANSGKLLWTASSASDLTGARGRFYSTPAVAYSRVYLGSTDGKVYAFDERTGKLVWAHGTGGYVYGSPAVYNGRVFIGSYSHVFSALNAATGNAVWTFTADGPISGSATVIDGLVYFGSLGPPGARRTYALDARTGKKIWFWHDGGFGPVVTDGSKLYVVGWGKVYAFGPRRRHR
jgi:outer membrane protein assembly factor BamB